MNKTLLLCALTLLLCVGVQATTKKSNLKILYVGGSSDLNTWGTKVDSVFLRQSAAERMASFEEMLNTYFETVEVMDAKDYLPEMSDRYDVTIFDGKPRQLTPPKIEKNAEGRVINRIAAGYLPETFDRPAVMVAEMGETLGRRIGLKTDWYCLCLDADAHSFRAEHPIFHGPFPVKMTLRTAPTPEAALHYAYFSDQPLPDSLPMWKVQTKGYATEKGFRVGMVSRPWGFEDSPEAEYISSGVCAKTLDAVAIGRHGNFLHWGFAASPKYMTEEAKTVFANAVVYISQFAGQTPIARKYADGIATHGYLREIKYLSTRKSWEERLKTDEEFTTYMLGEKKKAEEKKQRGESLTDTESRNLTYTPRPSRTYEQHLAFYQKRAFEKFGTDEQAYLEYYDTNRDYFYGGEGMYILTVDEDVKSLEIPVGDLRLLDKAISLREKGTDVEKARRILNRYTLCRFETAGEWRNWYEANKSRMFFTESGGWLYMVNTRDKSVPGNDYRNRMPAAQLPQTAATDDQNPVQVAIAVHQIAKDRQEVVVRIKIHPGYHIYARVSDSDPFIPMTVGFRLPQGYQLSGDLKRPAFKSFGTSGTTIYEKEAIFRQEITGNGKGQVVCTVGFQCCDSHICMPPENNEYTAEIQ